MSNSFVTLRPPFLSGRVFIRQKENEVSIRVTHAALFLLQNLIVRYQPPPRHANKCARVFHSQYDFIQMDTHNDWVAIRLNKHTKPLVWNNMRKGAQPNKQKLYWSLWLYRNLWYCESNSCTISDLIACN